MPKLRTRRTGSFRRRGRSTLVVVLVASLGLLAVACSSSRSSSPATTTAATPSVGGFTPTTPGVLTVGTQLPAPPFWNGDNGPTVDSGYEYDLVQHLATQFGLSRVEVVQASFADVVAGRLCDCDLFVGQVYATDARRAVVDLSATYLDAAQGVLVREGGGVRLTTLASANAYRWGVREGAAAVAVLQAVGVVPTQYATNESLYKALTDNEIDAVLLDLPLLLGSIATGEVTGASVIAQVPGGGYAAVLAKGSPNTAPVNEALARLEADGTLEGLAATYLRAPATPIPVL